MLESRIQTTKKLQQIFFYRTNLTAGVATLFAAMVRYGCPLNRLDINLNGSSLSIMGRTASMNTIQLE